MNTASGGPQRPAPNTVLVHGLDAGLAPPDWPPLQLADLQALAERVPALQGALRILWRSPRPFASAARVRTPGGEVFVKRHHRRVRSVASLAEEHAFLAHLRPRAVSVPTLIADTSGQTALGVGDWTYEVHAPAPGVDAYREDHSWTPVRSESHAWALGRTLAQLHAAAAGYDAPARSASPLQTSFAVVGESAFAPALERFVAARPALAQYLDLNGGLVPIIEVLGPLHAPLVPLLPALPPLWVHNDWHASNLFWTDRSPEARVRAVIDFGLCNRGCAVVDLATALERNTLAWLQPQARAGEGNADIGRLPLALAILEGYFSLRPLSGAERLALPLLLPLCHVEFALSEVDYFHGVLGNATNARLAHPDFLLGHPRWFAGRHGQDYLAGLRQWLRAARNSA